MAALSGHQEHRSVRGVGQLLSGGFLQQPAESVARTPARDYEIDRLVVGGIEYRQRRPARTVDDPRLRVDSRCPEHLNRTSDKFVRAARHRGFPGSATTGHCLVTNVQHDHGRVRALRQVTGDVECSNRLLGVIERQHDPFQHFEVVTPGPVARQRLILSLGKARSPALNFVDGPSRA